MNKDKSTESTDKKKKDIIFCSECGKELDNFALSEMVKDYNSIIQNFADCKKNGRFKGDLCSKIFIARDEDDKTKDDGREFF